jgi:hypothetical protein
LVVSDAQLLQVLEIAQLLGQRLKAVRLDAVCRHKRKDASTLLRKEPGHCRQTSMEREWGKPEAGEGGEVTNGGGEALEVVAVESQVGQGGEGAQGLGELVEPVL